MNGGYLCLYLQVADPASLPPLWRREVKFSLTVVNKSLSKSNRVLGKLFSYTTALAFGSLWLTISRTVIVITVSILSYRLFHALSLLHVVESLYLLSTFLCKV